MPRIQFTIFFWRPPRVPYHWGGLGVACNFFSHLASKQQRPRARSSLSRWWVLQAIHSAPGEPWKAIWAGTCGKLCFSEKYVQNNLLWIISRARRFQKFRKQSQARINKPLSQSCSGTMAMFNSGAFHRVFQSFSQVPTPYYFSMLFAAFEMAFIFPMVATVTQHFHRFLDPRRRWLLHSFHCFSGLTAMNGTAGQNITTSSRPPPPVHQCKGLRQAQDARTCDIKT